MTDQNRNRSQQNRGPQSSDETRTTPRHDDESMDQGTGSTSRNRSNREPAEMADDKGTTRERQDFSGAAHDLDGELDDSRSMDDTGDLDDELDGGSGRSNR